MLSGKRLFTNQSFFLLSAADTISVEQPTATPTIPLLFAAGNNNHTTQPLMDSTTSTIPSGEL